MRKGKEISAINPNRLDWWLRWFSFAYLIIVILALVFMYVYGDRWWPATFFLFGPRWLFLLPLLLLIPQAVASNRRLLILLVFSAIIIVGPFMGFSLPHHKAHGLKYSEGPKLRVLSCNIQSGNFDGSALTALILEHEVDIVALQECPRNIKLDLPPGWVFVQEGGLAVFSKYAIHPGNAYEGLHPPHVWPRTSLLSCIIKVPGGDIDFNTVHLPSPRYGLQHVLDRKSLLSLSKRDLLIKETENRLRVSQEVQRVISSQNLPVIIAGDFNMPVESFIYRQFWSKFANAFSKTGFGYGWSERASIRGIPIGVRIDHILAGKAFTPLHCDVGPDIGSDHLPLIADLARTTLR